jgi:hypothetical protein
VGLSAYTSSGTIEDNKDFLLAHWGKYFYVIRYFKELFDNPKYPQLMLPFLLSGLEMNFSAGKDFHQNLFLN